MNKKALEAFAREAAKSIKTEKDLSDFCQMLTKITVETALSAELANHLGYDKHQASSADNCRNVYATHTKTCCSVIFKYSNPLNLLVSTLYAIAASNNFRLLASSIASTND